jgi:hypothetical protein
MLELKCDYYLYLLGIKRYRELHFRSLKVEKTLEMATGELVIILKRTA